MNYLDFNSNILNVTSVTLLRNLKILFENEGKLFILYSSLEILKTARELKKNTVRKDCRKLFYGGD